MPLLRPDQGRFPHASQDLLSTDHSTMASTDHSTMASASISEDTMADNDEPPDELMMATPRARTIHHSTRSPDSFAKKEYNASRKNSSLLTQMIHTSESEPQTEEDENVFSDVKRAHSSASTWSHGSLASTADLTSDGHNSPATTASPSPSTIPALFHGLPPIFNTKSFIGAPAVRTVSSDSIEPLSTVAIPEDQRFEAGLGRKRCIQFACGRKEEAVKPAEKVVEAPKAEEPVKRACVLKFICPTRQETVAAPAQVEPPRRASVLKFACPFKERVDAAAPPKKRLSSPPPTTRNFPLSPKEMSRVHRGSDATVRNESPKSVHKIPSSVLARQARNSADMEIDRSEATRFHEFASSDEEVDDWTQESTCHRSRLTVSDTLRVENNIRKACTEAEEEDEDEDDVDDASDADDLEMDDDEEDDDDEEEEDSTGHSSDDGFDSDDEEGFACSDDESDAGSDFEWWAPGRRASMSEPIEHIRPIQRRTSSASSIESMHKGQAIKIPARGRPRRAPKTDRPMTPELPDSTDFVCGTLDEDRPAEMAYLQHLERRRLANRRQVPQDIDPTFPESDPEMEEEDEDSEHVVSESDQHTFLHGQMDDHEDVDMDETDVVDAIPRKRSPPVSPKRMRSPPPTKRINHRSPPPRRNTATSPQRRCRSPPPARHRSPPPPPSRRASIKTPKQMPKQMPVGLDIRPRLLRQSSSLPRSGFSSARQSLAPVYDEDEDAVGIPARTAIDIVKGLEKKRQRRREKLYEKHCRNKAKRVEKVLQPGKGCERMREVGIELNNYRGKKTQQPPCAMPIPGVEQTKSEDMHILSI